jgi:hypothetical protein
MGLEDDTRRPRLSGYAEFVYWVRTLVEGLPLATRLVRAMRSIGLAYGWAFGRARHDVFSVGWIPWVQASGS